MRTALNRINQVHDDLVRLLNRQKVLVIEVLVLGVDLVVEDVAVVVDNDVNFYPALLRGYQAVVLAERELQVVLLGHWDNRFVDN